MRELKIFYPDYFPSVSSKCTQFPQMHVNERCMHPGTMVEIFNAIAADLSLKIIPMTAFDFGKRLDEMEDVNTLLYELVANGSIDTIAAPLQNTSVRAKRFDFTKPIYYAQSRVIRKAKSRHYEQMWSFFQTYDMFTWVAFALAWMAQLVCCVITQRCEAKMIGQKPPKIAESAWQILRIQLLQPETVVFRTKAGKFSLFLFSLVQCSILLGVFSSFVLANIINTHLAKPISSLNAILRDIDSGEYRLVANNPQKWIYEVINVSSAYPYAEFRKALALNPLIANLHPNHVMDMVEHEHGIVINQDDDRSYYKTVRRCSFAALSDGMPIVSAHLMFRRDHPLLPELNRAVSANLPRFQLILTKYWRYAQKQIKCKQSGGYQPLRLGPYIGLFTVGIGLCVVAVLMLQVELCMNGCKKKKAKKRRNSDSTVGFSNPGSV